MPAAPATQRPTGGPGPRPYRSALRDAQKRATRRAVVSAAHDLFVEAGYAATTIDAVAERAGVSRKTVFTAAGGKAVLLGLALDWALVGDDEPVPMSERPELRAWLSLTDPAAMVAAWSTFFAGIESRVALLALVMAAGADADPEVRRVHEESERGRRTGVTVLVRRLRDVGGLRPGLSVPRAVAVVGVLSEPLVYRRLVVEAGWPLEDYAGWLAQSVTDALLPR